jgi:hypothetical protein
MKLPKMHSISMHTVGSWFPSDLSSLKNPDARTITDTYIISLTVHKTAQGSYTFSYYWFADFRNQVGCSCQVHLSKPLWYMVSMGGDFFHPDPGSNVKKIPDPGSKSTSKNLIIFNPKNCF